MIFWDDWLINDGPETTDFMKHLFDLIKQNCVAILRNNGFFKINLCNDFMKLRNIYELYEYMLNAGFERR